MNYKAIYAVKVWLTAAFGTPILIMLWEQLTRASNYPETSNLSLLADAIGIFITMGFVSALFSIPSFLILWVVTHLVTADERLSIFYKKLVLTIAGVMLTALPFIVLMGFWVGGFSDYGYLIVAFSCSVTAGIWFYRLPLALNTTYYHQTEFTQTDSQLPGNRQEALPPAEPEVS